MEYGELTASTVDRFTDKVLAFLSDKDRGFCQETESENCFLLAEISDRKTSDALCSKHYYQRQGRRNLQVIRDAERGL